MLPNTTYNQVKTAVDVQDLRSQTIIDAFLERSGEVFKTARGRTAILIGTAALNELKRKLSLDLTEGEDGTFTLKG